MQAPLRRLYPNRLLQTGEFPFDALGSLCYEIAVIKIGAIAQLHCNAVPRACVFRRRGDGVVGDTVEKVDAAVRGWAVGLQSAFSISGYELAAMVFALIGIFPFGWRGLYALALLPLGLIRLNRILPESKRFEREDKATRRRSLRRAAVHRAIQRRGERYQPCPLPISKSFNRHGLRHRLIGALMIVFFATASSWSTPSPLTPTAPIKTPPPHAPPLPLV